MSAKQEHVRRFLLELLPYYRAVTLISGLDIYLGLTIKKTTSRDPWSLTRPGNISTTRRSNAASSAPFDARVVN